MILNLFQCILEEKERSGFKIHRLSGILYIEAVQSGMWNLVAREEVVVWAWHIDWNAGTGSSMGHHLYIPLAQPSQLHLAEKSWDVWSCTCPSKKKGRVSHGQILDHYLLSQAVSLDTAHHVGNWNPTALFCCSGVNIRLILFSSPSQCF